MSFKLVIFLHYFISSKMPNVKNIRKFNKSDRVVLFRLDTNQNGGHLENFKRGNYLYNGSSDRRRDRVFYSIVFCVGNGGSK